MTPAHYRSETNAKAAKKPVVAVGKAGGQETRRRAVAKAAGLNLTKQGKGWQLVDAVTGTQVAATWTDDAGLTLEQIGAVLRNHREVSAGESLK